MTAVRNPCYRDRSHNLAPRVTAEPRLGQGWPYGASVRTSYGGTKADLVECAALALAGRLTIDVETFPPTEGITAFDRLESGSVNGRAVLVP